MTRPSRGRLPAAIASLAVCSLTSCQYLTDRSLDFLDQFRATVGAGSVVGARAKAAGLVDTGVMLGVKPRAAALGWKYGGALYFNGNDRRIDADQAEIIKTTSLEEMEFADGSYLMGRNSAALLPAVFSWVDSTPKDFEWYVPEEGDRYDDRHWLWSAEGFENNRWAQIHAFDFELDVGFFVYSDVGYSPGELLDFLLGFFLIDIAGDDGRLGGGK